MHLSKIKQNKKAALELSIGTVVVIVLAMSMLILGIILIRNIFSTATSSITEIDQGVKNEINRLFSEGEDKTLILFPDSNFIEIERGSSGSGFVVAMRNKDEGAPHKFKYDAEIVAGGTCANPPTGITMIEPGTGTEFNLEARKTMENPIHITFQVSQAAPLCNFIVKVTPSIESTQQDPGHMTVKIVEE